MYTTILVPMDLNTESLARKAVHEAAGLARRFDAELVLLSVVPGFEMPMVGSFFPEQAYQTMVSEARTALHKEADALLADSGVRYQCRVQEGKTVDGILAAVDEIKPDLMVMASHKRARLEPTMLGNVANKVVAKTPVPVLVIKPDA